MKLSFAAVISGVIFILTMSCSESQAPEGTDFAPTSASEDLDKQLRIIFRWPGDDFASKQDLATRNKIERLISERGVGNIIRTGTGMGWMDIVVEVENKERARIEIEKIGREISPNSNLTIR